MAERRRSAAKAVMPAVLLSALVAGPILTLPAAAEQAEKADAPDFSNVTTKAAARRLVRKGELIEILYFPAELGGPDEPQNVGYVTPEAAAVRDRAIGTFVRFAEDGEIDQLTIVPDYKGDSVVPSRITMLGTLGEEDAGIATTIEVW